MYNLVYLLADRAYAIGIGVSIPGSNNQNWNFNAYVYAILNFSVRIGIGLSGLMIVYAGIKYMLSQGNQTQASDAKDLIISAVIGFSLLLLIALILKTLNIPLRSY